jgi:multidrug efflux pump subunit AcrA (membrane-fusion protein)
MGVKTKKMVLGSYTTFSPVPAVIAENPANEQPLFAPFGGRIKSIDFTIGEFKNSHDILIRMYRNPIKRVQLKMVDEILTPASEEFHNAISSLRQNLKGKEVLQNELKRLQEFQKKSKGISIVPQKDLIDLKYEIEKVTRTVEEGRKKLGLHGLNKKEITQLETDKFEIDLYRIWKNSLKSNNIWNKQADIILNLLDDKVKKNRWTIAAIGELVAEDILSEKLSSWLKKEPNAGKDFLEIASLLQQGHTIEDIQNLYQLGVFNPIIEIKAPANKNGWDIENLFIKVGQKVTAGEKLLTLNNHSQMYLIAYPQASEMIDMTKAAKENSNISASPLTRSTGPELQKLKVNQIHGLDDGREQVILIATNSIHSVTENNTAKYRIWSLRNGLKYILEVPISTMKEVISVPLEAIIKHGPEKIIFVKVNGEFIRRKVSILYQDSQTAVLSNKSELKPGDTMIISGAFALQQALVAGTPEAIDPHAGHNH